MPPGREVPKGGGLCQRKDAAAIHVYEKAGFRDTGYTDPDTPDSLCMAWNLPETWRGMWNPSDL